MRLFLLARQIEHIQKIGSKYPRLSTHSENYFVKFARC
ncbi:hypothetical protein IMCC12053_481 [Celeribacter marinus]|uniref:Uncharacterized protein n=1 Tax=Celeribacter marinus TaxID=1397108 RepID=A0A0P0A7U7_9RHOB|nr:hypothetical protein IMCC12053_481 [Celeribacter marinus]